MPTGDSSGQVDLAARADIIGDEVKTQGRVRALVRSFTQSSLVRNSAALVSGTIVSQAILFLCSPLLSRTFAAAAFGELANYSAWVTILGLLSSFRYEHAIIISRDRDGMNRVLALTLVLCAISVVAYALLATLIYGEFAGSGYFHAIRGFMLFIPVGVLAACIGSPMSQLSVKTGHFKRLGVAAGVQAVFTVGPQLVLGRLEVPNGLIIGAIIGSSVWGLLLAWLALDRQRIRELWHAMRIETLRATAREHVHFPRYTLGADAIAVVVQQFVPVLILGLFTPALAGLYSFSMRVSRVPLIVIATAAGNALRKEGVDRLYGDGGLTDTFNVTTRSLLLIAIIPFLVMLAFGPWLFVTIFGHQWLEAGRIVQILSPGILFEFVAFPLTVFFLITNKQYYSLIVQIVGFVALASALIVGKLYFKDFMTTCFLVSGVMVVVNIAVILLARRVARQATQARSQTLQAASVIP